MNSRGKFWIRLLSFVFVVALIFVTPYNSTTSPQWDIQVLDENGRPVSNLHVTEQWSYFGIDLAPHLENGKTDAQGRIKFPRRMIWASLASRLLNFEGAQKVGPSVWVLACDDAALLQGEFFWDGDRLRPGGVQTRQRQIVAKPVKYCTMM